MSTKPRVRLMARAAWVLRQLRKGRPLTAPEIARRLDVSVPTARRTIQWLRDELNAPIAFDHAKNRYVLADKDWKWPVELLGSPEQTFAMAWAVRVAYPTADLELAERVQELFEVLAVRLQMDTGELERALEAVTVERTDAPRFESAPTRIALECIGRRRMMDMVYDSPWKGHDALRQRRVFPLHVRYIDGRGYLLAREGHRWKVFALERIREAAPAPSKYGFVPFKEDREAVRRWCASYGVWFDDEVLTVRVWVAPSHAEFVRRQRWHASCRDETNRRGELVRTLTAARSPDLVNRLLALGDGLVWVEPREVREDVLRAARGLAARLRGDTAAAVTRRPLSQRR